MHLNSENFMLMAKFSLRGVSRCKARKRLELRQNQHVFYTQPKKRCAVLIPEVQSSGSVRTLTLMWKL